MQITGKNPEPNRTGGWTGYRKGKIEGSAVMLGVMDAAFLWEVWERPLEKS